MRPRNNTTATSPSPAGPTDPAALQDLASGILTAAVLLAVIFLVILGFFVCALIVRVRKRRRQARERDMEAAFMTALGSTEGQTGLTILRGLSFRAPSKSSAAITKEEEARKEGSTVHGQLFTLAAGGGGSNLQHALDPAYTNVLVSNAGHGLPRGLGPKSSSLESDISPYAVSRREGTEVTVPGEEDRGDSGLARSCVDVRSQASLDTFGDRDYTEVGYTEAEAGEQKKIPLPYMRPINLLPPSTVQPAPRPPTERETSTASDNANTNRDPELLNTANWKDDGHYAQLYATLEQHFYSSSSTPGEEDDYTEISPEDSGCDEGGYVSTVLASINTMDVKRVNCSNFSLLREVGDGHFGQVYLAESVGLSLRDLRIDEKDNDTNVSVLVAVKSLKENSPIITQCAFVKEVRLMSKLSHNHIVNLLGVCNKNRPFMVMEFMIHGDLKHHLQKLTLSPTETKTASDHITMATLVNMCVQVADGMQYLASLNLVHRDLAARNCLLGINNTVKVGDFGMTRALHKSGKINTALPIRHIPYECFQGSFSEKSDVWSFGVTVWEILTLGKITPYNNFSNRDLMYDALKGPDRQLLPRPPACSEELYSAILKDCWNHSPKQRPTFKDLHSKLSADFM